MFCRFGFEYQIVKFIFKKLYWEHFKINCVILVSKNTQPTYAFPIYKGGYPALSVFLDSWGPLIFPWTFTPWVVGLRWMFGTWITVRVFLDSFKLASSCLPVSWHLPFDIPVNLHSLGRRFMMNVGDLNHLSRLASLSLWICTPWGALSVLKFCSSCAGFSGKVWTLRSLKWRSSVLPSLLKR